MDIISISVGLGVGLLIGILGAVLVLKTGLKKKRASLISEAEKEGEGIKKDKILQAKEKFLELKQEHEKAINEREKKIQSQEDKLKSRKGELDKRSNEIKKKEKDSEQLQTRLNKQIEANEKKGEELKKAHETHVAQLEKIADISADEAKQQLIEAMKDEARTEAMASAKEIKDEAKMTANQEARKIVIQSIQRVATEEAVQNAVTVFNIENDDLKGRIIGREGRNIRALESCTGVEFVVDDTPEAIILSCFDPVRREIARLALHQLVSDGRIHPARIEEVVEKTRKQLEDEIAETGKRTCIDLGIHGLHSELTRMVGRMKYRSSYGQNLLQHSREVANLASTMASELGLDPKLAKRAGLLHDIGKVPDDEPEQPHAILGMKLAEKHNEKAEVCNAIGAHHDEVEMTSLLSPVIQVCDAVSGARPGARSEVFGSYLKRIQELEELPLSYEGVTKSFAIQAGRELRVMVESDKVSDQEADKLSFDISQKIQNEMTYPGQVKVTVIRETRAVNVAK